MLTLEVIEKVRRLRAEASQGEIFLATDGRGQETCKIEGAVFIYDEGGHEIGDARLICSLWNLAPELLDAAEFALKNGFVLEGEIVNANESLTQKTQKTLSHKTNA